MSSRKTEFYLSVADYLAGERESKVRHEYVDGVAYAMAGASDRHNRIALNMASRLNEHLSNDKCETFMSDMKIKVDPALYYYPNVAVTCDKTIGDAYARAEPRLIVEVMSPSTERIDRHKKLRAYQRIASLQEYVLARQDEMMLEIHRRQANGEWAVEAFDDPGEQLTLASVGLTIHLGDVYRNVRFDASSQT